MKDAVMKQENVILLLSASLKIMSMFAIVMLVILAMEKVAKVEFVFHLLTSEFKILQLCYPAYCSYDFY